MKLLIVQGGRFPRTANDGLKIDIGQVANNARVEAELTFKHEGAVARSETPILFTQQLRSFLLLEPARKFLASTFQLDSEDSNATLEMAAVKLETINGWVDQDTWLHHYLTRRGGKIILDPRRKLINNIAVRGTNIITMGFTYPLIETLLNKGILYLNGEGVNRYLPMIYDKSASYPVSVSRMQEEWDLGQRSLASDVANLNMVDVANNVLRAII